MTPALWWVAACSLQPPSLTWRGDEKDDVLGYELAVRSGPADRTTLLARVDCNTHGAHQSHTCSGVRVVGLGATSPPGRVSEAATFTLGGEGLAWVGDPDGDGDEDFAVAWDGVRVFDLAGAEAGGVDPEDAWARYDEPFGLRATAGGDIDRDGVDDLCWGSFGSDPALVGMTLGPVPTDGDPLGARALGGGAIEVGEVQWAPGGVFVSYVPGPHQANLRFAPIDEEGRPRLDLADEWLGCDGWGALSVADLDGDGLTDAFYGGWLLSGALPGDCQDVAVGRWSGDADDVATGSAFGDFDGDGVLDLAVGSMTNFRHRRIGIFLGPLADRSLAPDDADRVLTDTGPSDGGFGEQVEAADVDGDGRADLVTTAPARRGGRIFVWFGADLFP